MHRAIPVIIIVLSLRCSSFARAEAPVNAPRCEFGVEGPMPREGRNPGELPIFLNAVADLGAQFIVASFTPEWHTELARRRGNYIGSEGTVAAYREFADLCRQRKLSFFIDQQVTSYCVEGEFVDKAGKDVLAHGDGTHRWDVSGELLATLSRMPEFRGVVYDEAEWNILRRDHNTNAGDDNASSGRIHPYFAVTEKLNVFDAYDATVRGAEPVAEAYRKAGVRMMGEHVFPVMFHAFARAGIDPCTKFMKEGRDSVYGAIALGAALQYDRDFCVSPDMWGLASMGVSKSGFPGHTPEELRCSLLLAYWMGASRVFVENIHADFLTVGTYKTPATGLLDRVVEDGKAQYVPSKYGEVYRWFVKEYVPAHPRPYSFRDCRPDMAIIRFDDSYWGQRGGFAARNLYGGVDMPGPESKAWIGLWHLLTHGQTSTQGLSYHNGGWPRRHDFFTALNNVVVFDERVGKERLRGLKVVFLTGLRVSNETRQALAELVHDEGLICISQNSLAPPAIAAAADGEPMTDGKGKWLITEDFEAAQVRKLVGPWLGSPDEIRYRFGPNVLTVKRMTDDNSVEIQLTPIEPSPPKP